MSWKRYFRTVTTSNTTKNNLFPMPQNGMGHNSAVGTSSKYSSYLPEVYAGHPNRIQRYYQYDDMDRDSDINAALDTIADFCTQSEEQHDNPFEIHYNSEPNETEVSLLKTSMTKWIKLNNFRSRLWEMFRKTLKNGDAFFLRDPETGEWLWIDSFMVEMVKVDDNAGKEPDEYIIRGLDYNKQAKFATLAADPTQYRSPLGASNAAGARPMVNPQQAPSVFSLAGGNADPRQRNMMNGLQDQLCVVDAKHVIHLSLSTGMDVNWPFGASILEPIFKTFKQKELLEDAVIIYRVQRAPERRIFYIDVGQMNPTRAKAHIEQIKNEIHQRRIPNRVGGGACFDMNTLVPLLDGRTLSIEEIAKEFSQGKQNWAYSCNPDTGEMVPGKITWAGKTRIAAKVMRLTLDNSEEIICTPDHKFPIRGKGKIEAQNIEVNADSLIGYKLEKNIHVVNKQFLDNMMDVGTLTIDGKEEIHNFHTFAIKSGVYTYNSILDSSYNPLSMMDDYFIAQGSDGKGSKIETLPGGEMTGEIGDLLFFSKKLARGLRIPTSYLPLGGEEEGTATFNDGKLGAAMIQEFRFNKYCMRIQALLAPKFDFDFKYYLRQTGIEIDENLFELRFMPPQNFSKYRQIEVDAQQIQVYSGVAENKKLSERFKFKRFLNLTDEELLENEKLWAEENAAKLKKNIGITPAEQPTQDLSAIGMHSDGGDFDFGAGNELPGGDELPPGDEGAAHSGNAPTGGQSPGGAPPPSSGQSGATGGPAPSGTAPNGGI